MAIDDRADLDQPWSRSLTGRMVREVSVCGVFDAIVRSYARREVAGRERLAEVGQAIFVANHCSHVDTPVILRSLPGRLRRHTAVAAAADYFYTSRPMAIAVSAAFGTVPLERRGAGIDGTVSKLQPLIDGGWSLVVFAEGTRSRDGRVGRMRAGAAELAAKHGLPMVPIYVSGTHEAMPVGKRWLVRPEGGGRLARHTIRLTFGSPIQVAPSTDRLEAMERVRLFMESCGAQTTPDPKLLARRAGRPSGRAGAERLGSEPARLAATPGEGVQESAGAERAEESRVG